MRKHLVLLLTGMFLSMTFSTAQSLRSIRNALYNQNESWYGSSESVLVAKNVLLLQKENGGWPKNVRFYSKVLTDSIINIQLQFKQNTKDATIDNGATYSEMVFLAKMYHATKDSVYYAAFQNGMTFLFNMQYPNGGFKQFDRSNGYYTHITYNDNAMTNALQLIRAVASGHPLFEGLVDDSLRCQSGQSFKKGIECMLNTQYLQHGKKTVWCAQHDERTLLPAEARSYELPSLSGSESVGVVQLLMEIPDPDQRVKEAIEAAIEWFDTNRITNKRLERYVNEEGIRDLRLVDGSDGDDLWGRFCDLETNCAFVCDRDGIVKYDLSEIGYERRNGYGWYTNSPNSLFPKYKKWKEENLPSTH